MEGQNCNFGQQLKFVTIAELYVFDLLALATNLERTLAKMLGLLLFKRDNNQIN